MKTMDSPFSIVLALNQAKGSNDEIPNIHFPSLLTNNMRFNFVAIWKPYI